MNLATLQASLVAATTGRAGLDPALLQTVRADPRVPADERLAAYRANIRGAHLQALDQAYPVTREVLGPRYWRQLLESELTIFASPSADLNAYGDFVPSLLGEVRRTRTELRELPYLEHLATLEWAVHCAVFAADDPEFDWETFARLEDDVQAHAKLILSNALTIMPLAYPVDHIWRSHNGGETDEVETGGAIACCVHRQGSFDVGVTRLDRDDYALLELLPGTGIGELCNTGTAEGSTGAAQQIFKWIQHGWIVGFGIG